MIRNEFAYKIIERYTQRGTYDHLSAKLVFLQLPSAETQDVEKHIEQIWNVYHYWNNRQVYLKKSILGKQAGGYIERTVQSYFRYLNRRYPDTMRRLAQMPKLTGDAAGDREQYLKNYRSVMNVFRREQIFLQSHIAAKAQQSHISTQSEPGEDLPVFVHGKNKRKLSERPDVQRAVFPNAGEHGRTPNARIRQRGPLAAESAPDGGRVSERAGQNAAGAELQYAGEGREDRTLSPRQANRLRQERKLGQEDRISPKPGHAVRLGAESGSVRDSRPGAKGTSVRESRSEAEDHIGEADERAAESRVLRRSIPGRGRVEQSAEAAWSQEPFVRTKGQPERGSGEQVAEIGSEGIERPAVQRAVFPGDGKHGRTADAGIRQRDPLAAESAPGGGRVSERAGQNAAEAELQYAEEGREDRTLSPGQANRLRQERKPGQEARISQKPGQAGNKPGREGRISQKPGQADNKPGQEGRISQKPGHAVRSGAERAPVRESRSGEKGDSVRESRSGVEGASERESRSGAEGHIGEADERAAGSRVLRRSMPGRRRGEQSAEAQEPGQTRAETAGERAESGEALPRADEAARRRESFVYAEGQPERERGEQVAEADSEVAERPTVQRAVFPGAGEHGRASDARIRQSAPPAAESAPDSGRASERAGQNAAEAELQYAREDREDRTLSPGQANRLRQERKPGQEGRISQKPGQTDNKPGQEARISPKPGQADNKPGQEGRISQKPGQADNKPGQEGGISQKPGRAARSGAERAPERESRSGAEGHIGKADERAVGSRVLRRSMPGRRREEQSAEAQESGQTHAEIANEYAESGGVLPRADEAARMRESFVYAEGQPERESRSGAEGYTGEADDAAGSRVLRRSMPGRRREEQSAEAQEPGQVRAETAGEHAESGEALPRAGEAARMRESFVYAEGRPERGSGEQVAEAGSEVAARPIVQPAVFPGAGEHGRAADARIRQRGPLAAESAPDGGRVSERAGQNAAEAELQYAREDRTLGSGQANRLRQERKLGQEDRSSQKSGQADNKPGREDRSSQKSGHTVRLGAERAPVRESRSGTEGHIGEADERAASRVLRRSMPGRRRAEQSAAEHTPGQTGAESAGGHAKKGETLPRPAEGTRGQEPFLYYADRQKANERAEVREVSSQEGERRGSGEEDGSGSAERPKVQRAVFPGGGESAPEDTGEAVPGTKLQYAREYREAQKSGRESPFGQANRPGQPVRPGLTSRRGQAEGTAGYPEQEEADMPVPNLQYAMRPENEELRDAGEETGAESGRSPRPPRRRSRYRADDVFAYYNQYNEEHEAEAGRTSYRSSPDEPESGSAYEELYQQVEQMQDDLQENEDALNREQQQIRRLSARLEEQNKKIASLQEDYQQFVEETQLREAARARNERNNVMRSFQKDLQMERMRYGLE